ncbi:MAG TPA: hypothetical protein VGK82_00430 [Pyrinomonadaceae bacterium]
MTLTHRPAAILTALLLGLLALYLAFPTKAYYWDGVVFAQAIEDVASGSTPTISLAHPNHLVYSFAGYFFYRLLLGLGFGAELRAITALQILNSIFSAGSATILFLILRETFRSTYLPACMTLLFAFSATWWKFSTDANAYIPSVFFLLLCFYLVLPGRRSRPLSCALCFFAAMCFHELAVIAVPVFALGIYLQDSALARERRLRNAVIFAVVSVVLIVGAYALAFYFATGSLNIARLLHWSASYSPDADTRFAFWSNLGYSLRGQVRLFFGGRLNLLRGLMNPFIVLLVALFAIAVLWLLEGVLANLLTLKRRLRDVRLSGQPKYVRLLSQQKIVLLLAIVWAVVYLVFLFFWLPQNTFYRLFYLPAIIILLGLALSRVPTAASRRRFVTAAFVVAAGLANFLFLIYPYSHVEKYPPLEFALEMNREWPAGTVIYYGSQNSDEALVRYFTKGTEWQLLPAELPESAGAWLETSAIDRLSSTPEGARWLQTHTRPASLRELNNGAYRMQFVQISP